MATLDVPGARLHCQVSGDGPPLLLLCGNTGDADAFQFIAEPLAERYTVIAYDPRGNSRSELLVEPGPQTVRERADDAMRVLDALTDQPAFVFGSSGGAVTALELLSREPDRARLVIAHEPPMFEVLPDAAEHRELFDTVHRTYERDGVDAAMNQFIAAIGMPQQEAPSAEALPPAIGEMFQRMRANAGFFLAHELLQVVGYQPDVAALTKNADRLVFGVGATSRRFRPAFPAILLTPHTGAELVEFAGSHAGYLDAAEPFAATLLAVLAEHGG
ncbi:MAG TPA: alpha/beta hydrolase [Pseudonocardiaceae bacterium]|jgi:pimeloyl-ACP methyl ester carboxylesterase|nr:alpha/beta hydrolase [Pseudonocardiaceae bacterium]